MPKGQAGSRPAAIEKKTEKEKKKERKEEVQQIVAQISALLRQEQGTSADSPEWSEFENSLAGFLNGDIKGNAATLSIKLLDNIQNFAKGKKNFIESAKGQEIAKKLCAEMKKVPGAMEDAIAAPLILFLDHVGNGEVNGGKAAEKEKKDPKAAKKELEKAGWKIISSAPKTITVEEGKKEQAEAMEAVRKLHEAMGIKSPEEIKKEQKKNSAIETGKGLV